MRLIDRYLLRQLVAPTLWAIVAATGLALLSTSLTQLDLIVAGGQNALVFLKATALAMPQLINMVLPVSVFVAALITLNRLQTDQELVVCFAGGMSRWRVIAPALRLAAVLALASLVINLWIQPASHRAMREVLFEVRTNLVSALIREGEFTQPAPGLTVYAQSVDRNGQIRNLFIHRAKDDGGATTYTADTGRLVMKDGEPILRLFRGSTQELSSDGVLNYLTFDDYPFELKQFIRSEERIHYKPSDRYLHELLFADLTQDWEKRNHLKLLAEGHARLATPLYNLTFMGLAVWAILGGTFSRMGYGRRIAIAGGVAAVSRILGFISVSAAESEVWLNILQYAIPIGTLAWALRAVFRQKPSRFVGRSLRGRKSPVAGAAA
ncbi:LPS export ABC transporter permease LptF [Phenylobacterium parvum]|uniref:LPS export ABC transporter permease LptF n=1 Tax=Phenylobacterium parvum TaxID=2201350 RepID=A0A2Z3HVI9_9CAUL|nr:LPS export ABC transporter permease LptF [Phenylobacterium parvum]AWM77371.1 LPS export ABC transporter permease LptF [Phenylobacterium parvum]